MIIKPTKIYIFIYKLQSGGAERQLSLISRFTDSAKYKYYFVVHEYNKQNIFPIKGEIINLKINQNSKFIKHFEIIFKTFLVILKGKPDIIISSLTLLNTYVSIAALILKSFKVINSKIIIRIANSKEVVFPFTYRDRLLKLLYKYVDKFVVLTTDLRQLLKIKFNIKDNKIVTISNGVDISAAENIPYINRKFKYDIITIGRLVEQKNYPLFIQIIKLIKIKFPNIKVGIISDGPLRQQIEILIKTNFLEENIELLGLINPQEVFRIMSQSKTFLLTSNKEGFPNVVLEAMACGLPIVARNCPTGPSEILDFGKYGFLIPFNALPLQYADVLSDLLSDIKLAKRYSKLSSKRVNTYDIRVTSQKYSLIFDQLLIPSSE